MHIKYETDLFERVAVQVCEVVAEEGNTPPSCITYWGIDNRDDWCDACQSIAEPRLVFTPGGKTMVKKIVRVPNDA